jgi:two-component system, sensor histidine kinase and response regulator
MSRDDEFTNFDTKNPVVLVVDDNVDNQQLLAYLLEWIGYRTEFAGNGVQAVAAFARAEYAAVFMDCEMPQMDGFQATRELRRLEPPGRRTPILAITAHPSRDVRARCLAAGMDDCLTKPVTAEDLRAALTAVVREQRRAVGTSNESGEVDLVALAGLAEQIGTDALGAVLDSFRRETGTRLTRLHEAVAAGDPQEVARVAHAIKGGASSLGVKRVAELSDELQRLADAGSLRGATERAAALRDTFTRSVEACAELLDSIRRQRSSEDGSARIGAPRVGGAAEVPTR